MKILWTLMGLTAFSAVVYWAISQQGGTACTVCMHYDGGTACRRSQAVQKGEAIAAARASACGTLTGSMTRELECMRLAPSSVSCAE